MSQSLAAVNIHAIFSTKDRRPWLSVAEQRTSMNALLSAVSNRLDCPVIATGGTEDHVHVLFALSRKVTLMEWAKEVKRVSTLEWKKNPAHPQDFAWQNGYAMFSVSESQMATVQRYIANQEEHHKKLNFQDELRALLTRHKGEWDEKYLWG